MHFTRSIAVQGIGFGVWQMTMSGLLAVVDVEGHPPAGGPGVSPSYARFTIDKDRVVISVQFLQFTKQTFFDVDNDPNVKVAIRNLTFGTPVDSDSGVEISIRNLTFADPVLKMSALERLGEVVKVVKYDLRDR